MCLAGQKKRLFTGAETGQNSKYNEKGKVIIMREKTCCFTGHRRIPVGLRSRIASEIENRVIELISHGYNVFETGGALGFDTVAAQVVLRVRDRYPFIRLVLVLPCSNQTDGWCEHDRRMYNYIMDAADDVIYTSAEYTKGCMYKRNRRLVDDSSVCICWLRHPSGGTLYTVNYAEKSGLKIINIADK